MLDFPELFAPARIVSGLISMVCSLAMDLNPATRISEMADRSAGALAGVLEFFAICSPLMPRIAAFAFGVPLQQASPNRRTLRRSPSRFRAPRPGEPPAHRAAQTE